MSAENDKFEKMDIAYELLRFIDLMVRQNCRRAHYEHLTRTRPSKEDKDNIYATDNLKKVYDKPRDNIYQLLKNAQKTLKGVKGESVGPLPKKYWRYTKQEHKLLHDFLRKVQDHTPKSHFVWLDLQHYLFYVYRNFACPLPKVTNESLSAFFVCEMRELVTYLRTQDESQVWMRVFTLLREYCIFAQWHYSHSDKDDQPLKRFISYYEAMLTAARSLVPVFLEFEKVIYKNYQVCWIDFNTFLFIRFFYESDRVKTKVDECLKNKKIHDDTPQTYSSMVRIKRTWTQLEKRAAMVNSNRRLPDHTQEGIRDKRALAAHKKLLTATFWIERSKEVRKIIDMDRLDDNIFDLLKDKHFFPEGPGLNKNGQCICEECLIAKYKSYLNSNEDFSLITTEERTTYCRKCHVILNLDQFQRHVNSHIEDLNTSIVPPKALNIAKIMDVVKLGDSTVQLSEMFSDKLKLSDKYGDGIKVLHKNDSRTAYENFHGRKDIKLADKLKSGLTLSLREELITNGFIKPLSNDFDKPIIPRITTEKLAETELMLRDMRKLGHVPLPKKNGHFSHCQESSEPAERQNRCTCTYCELFAVPKIVDPRAKLRMRAHRRKDKKYEGDPFKPISSLTNGNNNTPTNTTKTENRVPETPEALRLPTILEDGSDTEVSKEGTSSSVNLAENNRRKTKAEIAQRKAAEIAQKKAEKKARQREKKEQEKLEAELESQRKLEEMVRAEEGQEQSENYLEDMKSQEEAKMKKKLKKARQAEKRANMIQENIPAVVTIRRVPGGENGTPSVTITLKGCTPVQDKLLTKLVEPKVEVQNLIFESNQALPPDPKDGKKKNKGPKPKPRRGPYKKPAPPEPPVSKIIARDVKVTLAVDPTPDISLSPLSENRPKVKEVKREREPTEAEIKALGNLRLPPGITITKVEGPVNANKNYIAAETSSSASSVLGKSGVIVVDTEKLIQKTKNDISNQTTETQKKKKKNKSKKVHFEEDSGKSNDKPKMVTLRNPMFQQFQAQNLAKAPLASEETAPAAIFTSENGMVTIRSSRLQQSIDNGLVAESPLGMPLMPDLLSPVTNFSNPNSYTPQTEQHVNGVEEGVKNKDVSSMDAQEILSGLPGIEITKIDKKCDHSSDLAEGISCNDAQVSIIPSNGTEFNLDLLHDFDKDEDWIYDDALRRTETCSWPSG